MPRFVAQAPARPVFEEHPMDALALRRDAVRAAPRPLLRAFVQACLAHVMRPRGVGEAPGVGEGGGEAAGRMQREAKQRQVARGSKGLFVALREPRLEAQLALMRDVKRVLIAMEVRVFGVSRWSVMNASGAGRRLL